MKDDNPLVSWLMCTHLYNAQVKEAIKSCLEQDYSDFELIIVANGPSANLIGRQIRDSFCDCRIRIVETEIRFLTFSLNLGLHFSRGKLIARMDSDDRSLPHRLSSQVEFLQKNPEVNVLGTDYEIIDQNGKILFQCQQVRSDQAIKRRLLIGNPLAHPTVMFRKETVALAGGYSGYILAEDYDLWVRLSSKAHCRFENLATVCLQYRDSSIGGGRGTIESYASVLGTQLRCAATGLRVKWIFASAITILKIFKVYFSRLIRSCFLFPRLKK